MSSPEFVSIRDLADPRVAIQWHEAVAVIAAVATWASDLGVEYLPDVDALGLWADGRPRVDPGATDGDRTVRQLGRALQALLHESAPVQLTELADRAARAADEESCDQFASALRFYERPNRSELLRGLVARASLLLAEAHGEREFEQLKERAREQAALHVDPPQTAHEGAGPRRSTRAWIAFGAGATLVAVAGAVLTLVPAARVSVIAPIARFLQPDPIEPKPLPDVPSDAAAQPRERAAGLPRAGHGGTVSQTSADSQVISPEGGRGPHEVLFTVINEEPGNARPADEVGARVYSAGAPGVIPPVLLRQQLPSEPPPGVKPDDVGVFELLVDQSGAVERVQLVSPTNRFHERMLVAAAKTWKFRPASLGGIPVRYRLKMRVTW